MTVQEILIVHYAAGETGRACGTMGGMRTINLSEVTCSKCQHGSAYAAAAAHAASRSS